MRAKTDNGIVRVADSVASTLHAFGIRHAFGMPGGEVVTLIDALDAVGIRFHLARHETAAAIMAAAASVRTGVPGLLVTTVGPGLANAVNGIADAMQEHVPLVVMSGVVERAARARYTHQVIDHAALLRPLVKASFEIEPESAASTVARALSVALTAPMGPVHLDISPAVAAARAPQFRTVEPTRIVSPRFSPSDRVVEELAARLASARRPLVLAGFDAARHGAGEALRRFAGKTGTPVITTYKAKGILPEDHPLSLGAAGLSPKADTVLLELVRTSDLLLMVGYDPIEMRLGWLDPLDDPERIVEITHVASDHAMHHAGLRLVGDISSALDALAGRLSAADTWPDGEPAAARRRLTEAFVAPDAWGPHAIIECLNEAAGADALVTVDSGAHRILLSQKWVAREPLSLLQSAGFCTMAAALPLAIGAKTAEPSRHVFAVMGDGGLEMGLGELATLRDLKLAVTVVVFQDRSLALIAQKQAQAGLSALGVALGETDFAAVAGAFGGHGANVEDADSLRRELADARERATLTLIACRFGADAYKDAF